MTRGFQSSVAPKIHFGLGEITQIDSVQVVWPDGQIQIIKDLAINQLIQIDYSNSNKTHELNQKNINKLFKTVNDKATIAEHRHIENLYNDFQEEILLPHQISDLLKIRLLCFKKRKKQKTV